MTKISNQYSLTNVLFADAVNGRVGIGTASPTVPLDVVGAGKFSGSLTTAGAIFTTNDSVFSTAGTITKHATVGLTVRGTTGSVFDFSLYSAGGTALITNPTGTNNINFNSGQVWFNGGNVGIGTSAPLNKFTVVGVSSFQLSEANDIRLIINPTASGINISSTYNTNGSYQPITISTSDTERMRIHPNGTKYFGTFNSSRLQINPAGEQVLSYTNNYYIWGIFNDSNSLSIESAFAGNIIFRAQAQSTSSSPTTAAERMRITSAGNLCIGTTTAQDARLTLSYAGGVDWAVGPKSGTSSFAIIGSTGGGGGVYVSNGGTSWAAWSDRRVKKNIEDLEYGLDKILSISPVRFDYLTDKGDNSSRIGFIAQDVQEQMPEIVNYAYEDILGMSSTDLVPVLVKAIQELSAQASEQQTQINELKALLNA